MGGSDDSSNIAVLTISEHSEAHRKLYEKYEKWEDYVAWKALSGQISLSEAKQIAVMKGAQKGGQQRVLNGNMMSFKGQKHSEQTKEHLKQINIGENNPMFGTTKTEEERKNLSLKSSEEQNPSAKLSREDVIYIRFVLLYLGVSRREIASRYGVTKGTIDHIAKKRTWKNV